MLDRGILREKVVTGRALLAREGFSELGEGIVFSKACFWEGVPRERSDKSHMIACISSSTASIFVDISFLLSHAHTVF